MTNKILLYSHGGSGNHGCEAIVRGSCKIMHADTENFKLYSLQKEEDAKYGLQACIAITNQLRSYPKLSPKRMLASFFIRIGRNLQYAERLPLRHLFRDNKKGDIAVSIGGDNYCYKGFEQYAMLNTAFQKKGIKTVLWGCSVEPDMIDTAMAKDLAGYSLITARESISYEALKKVNPNTKLYPDPAFQLDKTELPLPKGFDEKNTIGLNISPTVISYAKDGEQTLHSAFALVEHIINTTDMQIALIPHVVWAGKDDREVHKKLYKAFENTGRVVYIEDHTCTELKGYIARCRMFIGSRTHATIAAYSTCVPTVAVGYSVKAKGIAKDLFGTYENYVLPVQSITNKSDMVCAFEWLKKNEASVREHLQAVMPAYKAKALEAGKEIDLLKE